MLAQLLPWLLLFLAFSPIRSAIPPQQARSGCPAAQLQQCAEPLRALGVPLSKNVVRFLLQIPSPVQLLKNCQAYSFVMPCFRAKIAECGSKAQAEILRQLDNAIGFLCSPFSGPQQSQLLAHRTCIGRLLGQQSPDKGCQHGNSTGILHKCREHCLAKKGQPQQFVCMMRTSLSEQNLCLLGRMRQECGREATAFFTQLQREVFHTKYPVICTEADGGQQEEQGKRGNSHQKETTSTAASIFVRAKKKRTKTVARLSDVRLRFTGRTTGTKKTGSTTTTAKITTTTTAKPTTARSSPLATTKGSSSRTRATTTLASRTIPSTTRIPRNPTKGKKEEGNDSFAEFNSAVHSLSAPPMRVIQRQLASSQTRPSSSSLPTSTPSAPTSAVFSPSSGGSRKVHLLAQSLPFLLASPALASVHNQQNQQQPLGQFAPMDINPWSRIAVMPPSSGSPPNWNWAAERWLMRSSPLGGGGTRLVFFEVAPFEEMVIPHFGMATGPADRLGADGPIA